MTIEQLKDYWQQVSLNHKDVLQFLVGNNYDTANSGNDKYPLVFWEMPYAITMNLSKPIDTIQISFSVFLTTKYDNITDSHQAISLAKAIGDAIILYVKTDTNAGFSIDAANAISVREYSDDYVAGIRWDLTLTVPREICEVDLNDYFNTTM